LAGLKFPVFIKPRAEDASVGIDKNSLIFSKEKLLSILKPRLNKFPAGLLVESFLPGEEYSVAFAGNGPYEILGISVINYSLYKGLLPFLTYASKWEKKAREFKKIQPSRNAEIDKDLKRRIVSISKKAANALGCKGYFRVDLRTKKGKVFIIDVNPNPDINEDSGYIKTACQKGYDYAGIIGKIIQLSGA
jgi:D-alanine-D-alanine ligase